MTACLGCLSAKTFKSNRLSSVYGFCGHISFMSLDQMETTCDLFHYLLIKEKAKIAKKNIAYMSGKDVVELSSARRIAQLQLHFAAPSHGQGRKRSLDGAVF